MFFDPLFFFLLASESVLGFSREQGVCVLSQKWSQKRNTPFSPSPPLDAKHLPMAFLCVAITHSFEPECQRPLLKSCTWSPGKVSVRNFLQTEKSDVQRTFFTRPTSPSLVCPLLALGKPQPPS